MMRIILYFTLVVLIVSCKQGRNANSDQWQPCQELDFKSKYTLCNFLKLYDEDCNIFEKENTKVRIIYYSKQEATIIFKLIYFNECYILSKKVVDPNMFNPVYYYATDKTIGFALTKKIVDSKKIEPILNKIKNSKFNNSNQWFLSNGCRIEYKDLENIKVFVEVDSLSLDSESIKKELLELF